MKVLRAGSYYFAIVFMAGFVLGTLRVFLLVPAIGETAAVLIEIPVMLAISWWAAGFLTRSHPDLATSAARMSMGGFAFVMLMTAETILSISIFGNTPADHFSHYATLPGAVGLAGQIAFALIPWLRLTATGR